MEDAALLRPESGRPLAFTDDRESRGVDDEIDGPGSRNAAQFDGEVLASPRESRVVRGVEIDTDVADDVGRSVIREQVEMGVAVRMAVLELLAQNVEAGTGAQQ